ncbi:glycosyltransferase family A protein [Bacillus sp. NPDC060175]|uniref:glycosyltransferase family A protein n=1 Tax=Bacillus sp. NPDC060175 TaxID=3347061 RepID=UPI0036590F0A
MLKSRSLIKDFFSVFIGSGARNGEIYRHEASQLAKGKFVCYLSGDDSCFPDHLQYMEQALSKADFVHSRYMAIVNKEQMMAIQGSFEELETRDRMLKESYKF